MFILTLIEQICLKTDLIFQNLLKQVRQGKLDIFNVDTLNLKILTSLSNSRDLDTIAIIQKNKHWHLINCLQIECFAKTNHQTIIIFPTKHHYSKKDSRNFIKYEIRLKV